MEVWLDCLDWIVLYSCILQLVLNESCFVFFATQISLFIDSGNDKLSLYQGNIIFHQIVFKLLRFMNWGSLNDDILMKILNCQVCSFIFEYHPCIS